MKKITIIGGLAALVITSGIACSSAQPSPTSIPKAQIPTPTAAARPIATPTPNRGVEHVIYRIQPGDNLWKIYEMCCNIAPEGYEKTGFNNFVEAVKVIKRNGIIDPALINEGKDLYIHVAQIKPEMLEGMRKKYGVEWISIEEINSGANQIRGGTIIDKPVFNMHLRPRNNIETLVGQQAMKIYSDPPRSFSHAMHYRS